MAQYSGYRNLLESGAIVQGTSFDLVSVEGEDRLAWLHGQTTQDVAKMSAGDLKFACICAPTGHLITPLAIAALEGKAVLVLPKGKASVIQDIADRTIFMEDVRVKTGPDNGVTILLQGSNQANFLDLLHGPGHRVPFEWPEGNGLALPFDLAEQGWLVAAPSDHAAHRLLRESFPTATWKEFLAVQLELGRPGWHSDLNRRALPPEFGPAFQARYVSYQKGCYTGQEVLMRIHSRGHTNRTWTALLCQSEVAAELNVRSEIRAKAGLVTSCVWSPEFGWIAGALLQNDSVQPGSHVWVQTEAGEVKAEVRSMPLRA